MAQEWIKFDQDLTGVDQGDKKIAAFLTGLGVSDWLNT